MSSGTLNFSSDDNSRWLDGVAEDGEGGSINLPEIDIQIGLISNANGTSLGVPIDWYNSQDLANTSHFTGLTTFDYPGVGGSSDNGWAGFVIKSADGSDFQFNQFQFYDWGGWTGESVNVVGFRDGQQVATSNFASNSGDYFITSVLGTSFDRVDEIRITYADGGGWGAINNVQIADPPPPKVTSVTSYSANGTYKVGDTINVSVTFDTAVDVTGIPQLTLETGLTDRTINYVGGSGTSILSFSYTVQAGDTTPDLDYLSTNALSLHGGTIKAFGSTIDASLALPTPGASGSLGANKAVIIDGIAPTLDISSSRSVLKAGETTTITFTFSEDPGSSFTLGDVAVSGGTLSALSGTGLTRTATFTPIANIDSGSASIMVAAGSYTDAVGNAGSAGATSSITFDTLIPSVPSAPDLETDSDSGTSHSDNLTMDKILVFSGFADAGTTVKLYDSDGVTEIGSGATNGSGSWTITTSTLLEGSHQLTARAFDAAGNASAASISPMVTIDTTGPLLSITSSAAQLKADESATITFTFSEDPGASFSWDGATGDVVVSGGSLSAISGTGLIRTATFTPDAAINNGTASITVSAGVFGDRAGNAGSAGATPSLHFDTLVPSPPSTPDLDSASDTGASPTDNITSDTILTLTGSAEDGATITLYDTDGVTVIGTGTAVGGVWSITTAALSAGSHTLTARATDALGNTSAASAGLSVTVDSDDPLIASVTVLADGTYRAGQALIFTVHTSEAVLVDTMGGTPRIALSIDGNTHYASYVSGSGTTALQFSYTVQPGETDADGITLVALSSNGATLRDASGHTVDLTLHGVAGTTGVRIDGVAPTVAISSPALTDDGTPTISGSAETGATITLTVGGATYLITAVDSAWSIDLETAVPIAGNLLLNRNGDNLVSVTATDEAGNVSGVVTQTLTIDINDPPTGLVTISGHPMRGQTLTASQTLADADGLGAISYQWQADGVDITGATGTSYTLTEAAVGKVITIKASYTDGGGHAESVTSTATAPVLLIPDPVVSPNQTGGHNITISDPSQLTAALGTSWVDHVFYSGSGTLILPDTIENITLWGTADVQGNELGNLMRRGAGQNTLNGMGGNDTLYGDQNSDQVYGGTGNDVVSGGDGQDRVYGGSGNDNVQGGSGNDRVYGDAGRDTVAGGSGNDFVEGGSGNDRLSGGSGQDRLYGGAGRDLLSGGSGHDWLSGGAGQDTLHGGAGRDRFVFDTQLSESRNVDEIRDFTALEDRIVLEDAVFTALGKGTAKGAMLAAELFVTGAAAQDAQDRIIYDRQTGSLYYDADGTGSAAQVKFAVLTNKAEISSHDFFVI